MSAARADYAEAEFTFVISLTDPEEFEVYIIAVSRRSQEFSYTGLPMSAAMSWQLRCWRTWARASGDSTVSCSGRHIGMSGYSGCRCIPASGC